MNNYNNDTNKKTKTFKTITKIEVVSIFIAILFLTTLKMLDAMITLLGDGGIFFSFLVLYFTPLLLVNAIMKSNGVRYSTGYPFAFYVANKIYKKKTGEELEGNSYKELVEKLKRVGMIDTRHTSK